MAKLWDQDTKRAAWLDSMRQAHRVTGRQGTLGQTWHIKKKAFIGFVGQRKGRDSAGFTGALSVNRWRWEIGHKTP